MSSTSKTSYTEEFKQSAINLALESDQSYAQTARELGLNGSTLYNWISKSNRVPNPITTDDQVELKRLRAEVNQLRIERDILKKAAAYFAKHQK